MIPRPSVAPARGVTPGLRPLADELAGGMPNDPAMADADSVPEAVITSMPSSWVAFATDLLELTKPRIVTMILISTGIAALIGGAAKQPLSQLVWLLLGVGLIAGSAGAMNQVWEQQLDGRMTRTRRRPLPAGRLRGAVGGGFAVAMGVAGAIALGLACGPIPLGLALATWLIYVPVYTPLKVRSQWNTTVGAISGALPMLVGYTGGGGSLADPVGWLLVGVLVAWQYPHFMAIAWLVREEYAGAGFQMATTVDPTGRSAGWQSVAGMFSLGLCLLALVWLLIPAAPLAASAMTLAVLAATYPMTRSAWQFAVRRNDLTARRLLRASLLQLPASLLLLMLAAWYGGA